MQVSLQRYLLRFCPLTRSPSQEVQEERAVRAILVQLGCKVSCRRFAPDCVPKPPPEPPRGLQNGSQNEPKSSKMGSLGGSWGHLWPTWVPKRLLERQVGAKMGQVGAKMSRDEVKQRSSWGPMGANWDQVDAKMLPGGAPKAPSGGPRVLFGAFLVHPGAKMLICWNTSVSYMKTSIDNGCATPPPPEVLCVPCVVL